MNGKSPQYQFFSMWLQGCSGGLNSFSVIAKSLGFKCNTVIYQAYMTSEKTQPHLPLHQSVARYMPPPIVLLYLLSRQRICKLNEISWACAHIHLHGHPSFFQTSSKKKKNTVIKKQNGLMLWMVTCGYFFYQWVRSDQIRSDQHILIISCNIISGNLPWLCKPHKQRIFTHVETALAGTFNFYQCMKAFSSPSLLLLNVPLNTLFPLSQWNTQFVSMMITHIWSDFCEVV